jgi:hypothetical protein
MKHQVRIVMLCVSACPPSDVTGGPVSADPEPAPSLAVTASAASSERPAVAGSASYVIGAGAS